MNASSPPTPISFGSEDDLGRPVQRHLRCAARRRGSRARRARSASSTHAAPQLVVLLGVDAFGERPRRAVLDGHTPEPRAFPAAVITTARTNAVHAWRLRASPSTTSALHQQMAGVLRGAVEAHGVRASTFFITGAGRRGPIRPGRPPSSPPATQVGTHGWAHEDWAGLDRDTVRGPPREGHGSRCRGNRTGRQPWCFRVAPGGEGSTATAGLLTDLGYHYDASLGADHMRPSRLSLRSRQVPFVWPGVDGAGHLRPRAADPGGGARLVACRSRSRRGHFSTACS